jgi:pimeloyl-ACP methyl ester carboxylesterase
MTDRSLTMTDRSVMLSRMPMLDTPHGTIAYDVRGDDDGLPIVLLASGAHDRHDYDALRDRLPATGFKTIALDWPGHGESPLDGELTAMRCADVTEAVVAQLAPEGAVLVGNSVGGFSAARLALRRPELVKALVLIDSGGFVGAPPQVRAFCRLMARPGFLKAIYPTFARRYMRARTDADRAALATGIATSRTDPGLRAVAGLWRSFASPEHDLRADAPRIAAPTLILHGRRDPVIPLRTARATAAAIPGAELHVLDTGHVPHTSEPDAVAQRLSRWLASAPSALPRTPR